MKGGPSQGPPFASGDLILLNFEHRTFNIEHRSRHSPHRWCFFLFDFDVECPMLDVPGEQQK